MAGAGFEPATNRLAVNRTIQLCYPAYQVFGVSGNRTRRAWNAKSPARKPADPSVLSQGLSHHLFCLSPDFYSYIPNISFPATIASRVS